MKLIDTLRIIIITNGNLTYSKFFSKVHSSIYTNPRFVSAIIIKDKIITRQIGEIDICKHYCELKLKTQIMTELLSCELFSLHKQINNNFENCSDIFIKENILIYKVDKPIYSLIIIRQFTGTHILNDNNDRIVKFKIIDKSGVEIDNTNYSINIIGFKVSCKLLNKKLDANQLLLILYNDRP
jgi:hypothetical protein